MTPTIAIKKPKKHSEDAIRYHSEEEIQRLLKCIDSIRDRAIFTLAYNHGLRVSEVGLIKEGDVQLDGKQLIFRRLKRGRSRSHDLREIEIKLLKKWLQVRGELGKETPLFVSRKVYNEEGIVAPIGRKQLDRLMKKYGEKAELDEDKCYFHTLRHSCGTHMVNAKVPLRQIQEWLGHRDIKSTQIYANVSESAMKDTASVWNEHQNRIEGKRRQSDIDWSKDKK